MDLFFDTKNSLWPYGFEGLRNKIWAGLSAWQRESGDHGNVGGDLSFIFFGFRPSVDVNVAEKNLKFEKNCA